VHRPGVPPPVPALERQPNGQRNEIGPSCTNFITISNCSLRLQLQSPSPPKQPNILVECAKSSSQPIGTYKLISNNSIINPDKPTLTFPSDLYDALRFSTVTSELIMLRILKFELRVTLPQVYLPRLIPRCLSAEEQSTDEELQQTTLYRQTQAKIVRAYVP
jgi:hypothetical protein